MFRRGSPVRHFVSRNSRRRLVLRSHSYQLLCYPTLRTFSNRTLAAIFQGDWDCGLRFPLQALGALGVHMPAYVTGPWQIIRPRVA